jgi:hypothetical protein
MEGRNEVKHEARFHISHTWKLSSQVAETIIHAGFVKKRLSGEEKLVTDQAGG